MRGPPRKGAWQGNHQTQSRGNYQLQAPSREHLPNSIKLPMIIKRLIIFRSRGKTRPYSAQSRRLLDQLSLLSLIEQQAYTPVGGRLTQFVRNLVGARDCPRLPVTLESLASTQHCSTRAIEGRPITNFKGRGQV